MWKVYDTGYKSGKADSELKLTKEIENWRKKYGEQTDALAALKDSLDVYTGSDAPLPVVDIIQLALDRVCNANAATYNQTTCDTIRYKNQ